MSLNKSNGNMYDWVTHTWNPLGGECYHKCSYCSTNKLGERYPVIKNKYTGDIRLVKEELKTNLGKDNIIFVCAQHDLFAGGYSNYYDDALDIISYCKKFDNTYLFQTKNPFGINGFVFPKKTIFCTTIETNRWYPEHMGNTPKTHERAYYMAELMQEYDRYITIEPIMDFDLKDLINIIKITDPKQVNIGANSDPKIKLPEPTKEQILELIAELEKFTKVKQKKNLNRLIK